MQLGAFMCSAFMIECVSIYLPLSHYSMSMSPQFDCIPPHYAASRQDIHSELDLHSNLLEEIDAGVDKTSAKLKTQTKKVDAISQESGGCCNGCCGLIIIFALIVVIILLVTTNYGCYVFAPQKC